MALTIDEDVAGVIEKDGADPFTEDEIRGNWGKSRPFHSLTDFKGAQWPVTIEVPVV